MAIGKRNGSNPNRLKIKVGGEKAVFVKSKTQTPQVGKPKRKY